MPRKPAGKRSDGATIGVILILVLTSGFVAGTTATFTGTTTNAGNEFASAALSEPSNVKTEPQGDNVNVTWTNATADDNRSGGYRISQIDFQTMPNGGGVGSCTPSGYGTKLGNSETGSYTDKDTANATSHVTIQDGRQWCYVVQAVYPCCTNGEGINPWISVYSRQVKVVNFGMTITGVVFGSTAANGVLNGAAVANTDGPDYIEITFNQAVQAAAFPTGYMCVDGNLERIYLGINGTNTSTANCPRTTSTGADTAFSGFFMQGSANAVTGTAIARFKLGTAIQGSTCSPTAPLGCWKMKIPIQQLTAGVAPNVGGTWQVWGTINTTYLKSVAYLNASNVSTARNFCATQTGATSPSGGAAPFQYRASPTNGNCTVSGVAVGW